MISRRFVVFALLSALVFAGASNAHAGDDAATTEAKSRFLRGQRLYEVAKFPQALEEFTAAYEIKQMPDFLYNIGQCHRRLGHYDSALFFFRGFLEHVDDPATRAEVEALMTDVERAKTADAEAEREAAHRDELRLQVALAAGALAPTPTDRPIYRRWWFWTAAAAVVVGAVTGIALGLTLGNPALPNYRFASIDGR